MRKPRTDFDRAVTMLSEGMSKAAIARVLRVSPSTISRWLQRGGAHVQRFHDRHAHLPQAVEVQMDELSTGGVGEAKSAWAYSAIEVWSRFWAALHVGNRTLINTFQFTRKVRDAVDGIHTGDFGRLRPLVAAEAQPLLVTSDGFKYYRPAMRRAFRHRSVAYVQVENTYARGRVVRSESTLVLGSEDSFDQAFERSEDSKRPNTSYIERINLRKRMCCSLLRRRNPAPARSIARLTEALELVRVFYNFVHGHSSLKFGKVKRTPAMQAGIFSRPLTIREIFMWVPPPENPTAVLLRNLTRGAVR